MPTLHGWTALAAFALQNGISAVFVQFQLQHRGTPPISPSSLVFLGEAAVKLPASLVLYALESGGVRVMLRRLIESPACDWLRLCLPALLYTAGGALQLVGASRLAAPVQLLIMQSKVLFTAACSVVLLGTRLSRAQWVSLVMLSAGIVCIGCGPELIHWLCGAANRHPVQVGFLSPSHPPSHPPSRVHHGSNDGGSTHTHTHGWHTHKPNEGMGGIPIVGVAALLLAAQCSALASVHLESMIKQTSPPPRSKRASPPQGEPQGEPQGGPRAPPSLWLRNIQLSAASSLIAACPIVCTLLDINLDINLLLGGTINGGAVAATFTGGASSATAHTNPFDGIDALAFLLIPAWSGLGGVFVALVLKHANSILRGFATAAATILATLLSVLFLGFRPSPAFGVGACVVLLSMLTYTGCSCQQQEGTTRSTVETEAEIAGGGALAVSPRPFASLREKRLAGRDPGGVSSTVCQHVDTPPGRSYELQIVVNGRGDGGDLQGGGGDQSDIHSDQSACHTPCTETAPLKRSQTPR